MERCWALDSLAPQRPLGLQLPEKSIQFNLTRVGGRAGMPSSLSGTMKVSSFSFRRTSVAIAISLWTPSFESR